jgi:hypothetical protein
VKTYAKRKQTKILGVPTINVNNYLHLNFFAVVVATPSIFGEYTLHWWRFIFRHTSSHDSSRDI